MLCILSAEQGSDLYRSFGYKMRIAICEDEKVYSDILINRTDKYFSGRGISTETDVYTDGNDLLKALSNGISFDIIFLDIQLVDSDGLETAAKIRESDRESVIIFVTALEDRMYEGFSVSAFDYIVKNSFEDRIDKVLDRFIKEYERGSLTVETRENETAVIPFSDIISIESDGRGSVVSTLGNLYHTAVPVSKISVLLPEDMFTEIYLSVWVQISKIRNIGSDTVEMSDGKVLPVSRRKRKSVMAAVMKNMRGGISCRVKDIL